MFLITPFLSLLKVADGGAISTICFHHQYHQFEACQSICGSIFCHRIIIAGWQCCVSEHRRYPYASLPPLAGAVLIRVQGFHTFTLSAQCTCLKELGDSPSTNTPANMPNHSHTHRTVINSRNQQKKVARFRGGRLANLTLVHTHFVINFVAQQQHQNHTHLHTHWCICMHVFTEMKKYYGERKERKTPAGQQL